jgi:hypothetical protein
MTPQQEAAEREIIFVMITMLRDLRDAGHSDWQTLTSFLANLLMVQDNPPKMLKRLAADVKLKLNMMRQMRTPHYSMRRPHCCNRPADRHDELLVSTNVVRTAQAATLGEPWDGHRRDDLATQR